MSLTVEGQEKTSSVLVVTVHRVRSRGRRKISLTLVDPSLTHTTLKKCKVKLIPLITPTYLKLTVFRIRNSATILPLLI